MVDKFNSLASEMKELQTEREKEIAMVKQDEEELKALQAKGQSLGKQLEAVGIHRETRSAQGRRRGHTLQRTTHQVVAQASHGLEGTSQGRNGRHAQEHHRHVGEDGGA